ncbi:alpha/beta hydrolase [Salinispirillum sp. LH 10-3-1]|uniref:Alpha/beta hydrolase n=1 Tax=Salinispirillum sp. LH 10-3-1 TaxID=2952525 RepID=A0AB38YEG6_9GAMM
MICYLLNGWCCPPALLTPLQQALEAEGVVVVRVPDVTLEAWQDHAAWQAWVSQWYQPGGCLVGWSHGGTLAWQIAHQRADAKALLTLATAPRFVSPNNTEGMDAATFAQFYALAEEQPAQCLKRFQTLMMQGDSAQKSLRQQLKRAYAERQDISTTEHAALRHLATTNLAEYPLPSPCQRAHWFGGSDALIPAQVATQLPRSRVFDGVGHCLPLRFVSDIVQQVRVWSAL